MKTTYFLLALLMTAQLAISQSINDLDLKNGFRHFKFGSSPNQIKNIVKDKKQSSQIPNVSTYTYNGSDINSIANEKVAFISLTFFKNKLAGIDIGLGNPQEQKNFDIDSYNYLLSYLEGAYGNDWHNVDKDDKTLNGAIWNGKKVRLELIQEKYSTFIVGAISLFDKNLKKQMYLNTF